VRDRCLGQPFRLGAARIDIHPGTRTGTGERQRGS
jgi:hypothetical protein